MDLNANEKAIHDERNRVYGDAKPGHDNIGLLWTGLLQRHYNIELDHPIPADMVLLMLAATKLARAAGANVFHDDNYIDGKVYFELARDSAKRKVEAAPHKVLKNGDLLAEESEQK